MKNYFNYDFTKKAIIGSKSAINRANLGRGNEYRELCEMLAEHPEFIVISKEIKTNTKQEKVSRVDFWQNGRIYSYTA